MMLFGDWKVSVHEDPLMRSMNLYVFRDLPDGGAEIIQRDGEVFTVGASVGYEGEPTMKLPLSAWHHLTEQISPTTAVAAEAKVLREWLDVEKARTERSLEAVPVFVVTDEGVRRAG